MKNLSILSAFILLFSGLIFCAQDNQNKSDPYSSGLSNVRHSIDVISSLLQYQEMRATNNPKELTDLIQTMSAKVNNVLDHRRMFAKPGTTIVFETFPYSNIHRWNIFTIAKNDNNTISIDYTMEDVIITRFDRPDEPLPEAYEKHVDEGTDKLNTRCSMVLVVSYRDSGDKERERVTLRRRICEMKISYEELMKLVRLTKKLENE